MSTVAIVLLVAFGVALFIGGMVAIVASRKAPMGFEDEKGFHPIKDAEKAKRRRSNVPRDGSAQPKKGK